MTKALTDHLSKMHQASGPMARGVLCCLLLILLTPSASLHAQEADPVLLKVEDLINKARTEKDTQQANAMLREAESIRHKGRLAQTGALGKLRYAFAKADIMRARGQVAEKIFEASNQKNITSKVEAMNYFKSAATEYDKLLEASDNYAERIEQSMGRNSKPENNSSWREAIGMVSRAEYHLAWSWYDFGNISTNPNQQKMAFGKAIDSFMSFTSNGWANDEIVAECFLGQAMCLFAMGEHFEVTKLLASATRSNTPVNLFKRISWLKIKNHLAEPSYFKADRAASGYFNSLPGNHKYDNIDLEMMLDQARALASLSDPKANPRYHAKFAKRLSSLSDQIQQFGEPWRSQIRDVLKAQNAAMGSLAADDARKAFNEGQYKKSRELALSALKKNDAQSNMKLRADLEYIAILSAYNTDQWQVAFKESSQFYALHRLDPRRKAVGRLALSSALKARQASTKKPTPSALTLGLFLNDMNRQMDAEDFPDLRYWVQAEVELEQGQYAKAAATLGRINPDQDMYLASRYRIAEVLSLEIKALKAKDDKLLDPMQSHRLSTSPNLGLRMVQQYMKLRHQRSGKATAMDQAVATLAVELMNASFESPSPDIKGIQALISLMAESDIFASLERQGRQALDMRLAATSSDLKKYLSKIRNYLSNSRELDTSAARSLTYVSRDLEKARLQELKLNNQNEARQIDQLLKEIYEKLTDFVRQQDSPDLDERMIPIRYRLAATYSRLGDHQKTVVELNWILKQMPENQAGDVMRLLAIAYEKTGRSEASLELWRKLAKGLEQDSDAWLEARLHWIENTQRMGNTDHAVKLMKWTTLKSKRWKDSVYHQDYLTLQKKLGITDSPE